MIADSIAEAKRRKDEVLFDAEHFFDGYKANPSYALDCLKAAHDAGARWLVLCDTNGGTLPHEIERIVGEIAAKIPGDRLGIHCHNDIENAAATSLGAVRAGARQIQGTLNGLGERCGNANLISIIPNLMIKMGLQTGISETQLAQLTHVSRLLDERLNCSPQRNAAFVGERPSPTRAGCMSRPSRKTRAPMSTSRRKRSATSAISLCRTKRAAPTSWRASATSASRSAPTVPNSRG